MTDLTELSQDVAKNLSLLITSKVSQRTEEMWKYRTDFSHLESIIKTTYHDAKQRYEEAKENHLTTNMIESEGFLRCATLLMNELNELKKF